MLLLGLVLVLGETAQGAQRWLRIGSFGFQPSELAKLTVPLMVVWFISKGELPPTLWRIVVGGVLTLVPVALVIRQPDLGTSLLIVASGGFALFLSGLRWRYIVMLAAAGAACVPVLWHFMHDYQRLRGADTARSAAGPAGRRIPHHPVDDRNRLRRHVRKGLVQRDPSRSSTSCRSGRRTSYSP